MGEFDDGFDDAAANAIAAAAKRGRDQAAEALRKASQAEQEAKIAHRAAQDAARADMKRAVKKWVREDVAPLIERLALVGRTEIAVGQLTRAKPSGGAGDPEVPPPFYATEDLVGEELGLLGLNITCEHVEDSDYESGRGLGTYHKRYTLRF